MSKLIKLLSCLLTATMVFSSAVFVQAEEIENDNIILIDDLLSNEEFTESLNNYMIERFGEEFIQRELNTLAILDAYMDSMPTDRSGRMMFPDYYGGVYIHPVYRIPVILLVQDRVPEGWAFPFGEAIIRFVELSYNELSEIQQEIFDFASSGTRPDIMRNIFGFGVNVYYNRVSVHLRIFCDDLMAQFLRYATTSTAIVFRYFDVNTGIDITIIDGVLTETSDFRNFFDYSSDYSSDLSFGNPDDLDTYNQEQSEEITPFLPTINPGMGFPLFGPIASVGYRATINGVPGFVTAGHAVAPGQLISGIGFVTMRRVGTPFAISDIDAAFIRLDFGHVATNNLPFIPNSFVQTLSIPVVTRFYRGQHVAMLGMVSGGWVGQVLESDRIMSCENTGLPILTNMVLTFGISSQRGDSGGIVFCPTTGNTMGIVTGNRGGSHGFMFFTRAYLINQQFRTFRH